MCCRRNGSSSNGAEIEIKDHGQKRRKGRKMNTVISRLCALITSNLPPAQLIESEEPSRQAKQSERDVLISLSRVHKQIRRWKDEFDSEAEQDMTADSFSGKSCCMHLDQTLDDENSCIADITAFVVSYMEFKSEFVQHLAGNILVAIADLLIEFESPWVKFLHLLWIKLETEMLSITRSTLNSLHGDIFADESLEPQFFATRSVSGLDILRSTAASESGSDKASIYMARGLFRTLHRIIKLLKHVKGDLEGSYTNLARDFLLSIPKNMFDDISIVCTPRNQINSEKNVILDKKKCFSEVKGVLLGTILQFLCSFVEQEECCMKKDAFREEARTPSDYTDLILNLVAALPEHLIYSSRSLSLYLRHKALMLMIRLGSHSQHYRSHILVWLKLLKSHFGDLLYESISEHDVDCSTSLEDSPFIFSLDDGETKCSLCTRHLRRQAIFLFFCCCFQLANFHSKTHQELSHPGEVYSDSCKMQYGTNVGLLEFSDWLQRCASLDKLADYSVYRKSCCSFALSFLQLYVDEDDMLFEMLLLLQDAPFITLQSQNRENRESYEEMKTDILFHIFNIFHPIHLFHLLLTLLHYDHLVLVDYLISNDTGTHFLQYLLRCLRMICGSWDIFAGFQVWECDPYQPCYKRRKLSTDVVTTPNLRNLSPLPSEVKGYRTRKENVGSIINSTKFGTCENATECLLSLKKMVEDLHRKNLFPYNPEPLIRRLNSFEDCCNKQEP